MSPRLGLVLICCFFLAWPATALACSDKASEVPSLIAVKFHTDWSPACKQMGDLFLDLTNMFDGRSVLFVVLDRTNSATSHQARLLAAALGLAEIYGQHQGSGFILLLDGHSKRLLVKCGPQQSLTEVTREIRAHL